ncbi:MAG: PilT/PilU family type 4a pilus ATPase [Acidimicrobiia bacterium]|nr:PilT/PilU family type 4a pilus ATPase [Acidimicrobiia bacterium]
MVPAVECWTSWNRPGPISRTEPAAPFSRRHRAPIHGVRTPCGGRRVLDLDQVLRDAVERGASDVHIKVGSPPHMRLDGELVPFDLDTVDSADTERIAFAMMPKIRAEEFLAQNEADFAYSLNGVGRFRVNVFRQRGSVGMVLRHVLPGIPDMEQLGLPPVVRRLAEEHRGLVLVTGPTGSGKTTTLAAMIDHINETQARHIVTIEDPIEVLHNDKRSIINQREVGDDTVDFLSALKHALRQDPDVILIGEMRDPETVWAALSAAETGHLVFSTLHTMGAAETINRVIDFFPPYQQQQVRMSIAGALKGIVSQRLVPRADEEGRVPAMEVLVSTGRVFDKIADGTATHELDEIIADGGYYGMQSFDQSLLALYGAGTVSRRDALASASNPHDLRLKMDHFELERTRAAEDPPVLAHSA